MNKTWRELLDDLDELRCEMEQKWESDKCIVHIAPTSKWKSSYGWWTCTNCKHSNKFQSNYCPNCGARMEE